MYKSDETRVKREKIRRSDFDTNACVCFSQTKKFFDISWVSYNLLNAVTIYMEIASDPTDQGLIPTRPPYPLLQTLITSPTCYLWF